MASANDIICERQLHQGFEVYVLKNSQVEVSVVPELGARIISLKSVRTGREWMWHPEAPRSADFQVCCVAGFQTRGTEPTLGARGCNSTPADLEACATNKGGLKLFRCPPGTDFSLSPLAGMDECLPTIAPCSWRGRELPDHGEVWSASWSVDGQAWKTGALRSSVKLPVSPFEFERTLALHGNELRLDYQLKNLSAAEEAYLWAMHPLLKLQPGDQLELPASTRSLLNNDPWIDGLNSAVLKDNCVKTFAWPIKEATAALRNPGTGDRLEFHWAPSQNDTLGLWLTRGGWHGHQHFALEPTNGAPDALAMAAESRRCGHISPKSAVAWQVRLRIE